MIEYKGKLIVDTIEELLDSSNLVKTISKDDRGNKYSNNIVTFDTESCQIDIDENNSVACTVTYQIAVNDRCILVRTPEAFLKVLEAISKLGKADEFASTGKLMRKGVKVIVYVHNLQFDAYFTVWDILLKTNTPVEEVFLIKKKFNKFIWNNLQFRCSLMLTGMGLDSAIKEYVAPENRPDKLKGYWDYSDIRSPLTKLSEKEILYACVDVLGLVDVIRGLCKLHNIEVGQLPTASTSFTRNACKDYVLGKGKYKTSEQKANFKKIHELNLTLDQVMLAHDSFRGGISDTNRALADELQFNVGDWDICSEYPAVINLKLYPMSSPVWETKTYEELKEWAFNVYKYKKGFVTKVIIKNMRARKGVLIPLITKYKLGPNDVIYDKQDARIFEADSIEVTLNSVDFKIVCEQYDFEEMEILLTMTFDMDYLPKLLREFILNGYKNKTNYKGVVGKELSYKLAKIYINAIYGIMATFPLFDRSEIDGDDIVNVPYTDEEKEEALDKYNKNPSRFSYYLWGVYTAAYGHELLCEGLSIVGSDVIACDTDSVKFRNSDKYMHKFEEINSRIEAQYRLISEKDNISWDKYSPADPKGETHTIGTWDNDSKNLVAMVSKRSKCYLKIFEKECIVDDDVLKDLSEPGHLIIEGTPEIGNKIKMRYYKLTTAGIKPSAAMKEFQRRVDLGDFESIEDAFIGNISIPAEYTGKMTHFYHNEQKPYTYQDRDGNTFTMTNSHCITLKDAPFAFAGKDIDKEYYYGYFESEDCYL